MAVIQGIMGVLRTCTQFNTGSQRLKGRQPGKPAEFEGLVANAMLGTGIGSQGVHWNAQNTASEQSAESGEGGTLGFVDRNQEAFHPLYQVVWSTGAIAYSVKQESRDHRFT